MSAPRDGRLARRDELLLSGAFAVWGLAIAIAMISVWRKPAPPDQLIGLAKVHGFEASGPMRWMIGLILMPLVVPLVLRPVARLLSRGETWARTAATIAPLVALWLVTAHGTVAIAVIPCAAAVGLCAVFRNRPLGFTRYDVVLVPVFLTTLMAFIDLVPAWSVFKAAPAAAIAVLALRIAVTFLPSTLPPALAFLVAPLALVLQTGFFARDQRYFGWHALAVVVVSPFLVRLFARNRGRAVRALTILVFPLALFAYWNAMNTTTAEGKPRANFFEDGHALLPASEYLRGERPYADILPAHGLVEDGLFDYLVFQTGDVTMGRRAKAREVVGTLNAIALYALAWAVTGSAPAALLSVLLSIMTGLFAPTIRMLPPIATLAVIAAAVRWRRPRWFAWAAFGTVVCGATSLDFAAYTFVTLLVALIRVVFASPVDEGGGSRWRRAWKAGAIRHAATGLLAGTIPLFLAFALLGVLDDFFHGTFVEVLAVGPAYTLGFFTTPVPMGEKRFFPEVFAVALDPRVVLYLVWPVLVVFMGMALVRRWPRRVEPMVLLALWSALTGISYAERQHLYFGMAFVVIFVAVTLRLLRRRSPIAIALVAIAFILANPTTHMAVVGLNRTTRGPGPDWVEVRDVPRARGILWHKSDAAAIASVKKYVALSLGPDETFLDFANSGALYFLFRRDCPIRQYEVAFFETEELQREVIRRIESNPRVRAVLVANTPHGRFSVDIPNGWRAPLVQQYIVDHFEPDFEEGEIAFWRRK